MADKIELDAWKSTAPDTENTEVVNKLIKQFGLSTFTDADSKYFDNVLFRRGIVIAHRDFKLVEEIYEKFKSGEMASGELKRITADFVNGFPKKHREKRERTVKIAEKIVFG
ncbi:MAG: hypothetical protein LVQ95_00585 [Candidatus Micrarchaeales archaeon]|nr:hypothetical protein [Candidatus Micrarchaeales archaeon]